MLPHCVWEKQKLSVYSSQPTQCVNCRVKAIGMNQHELIRIGSEHQQLTFNRVKVNSESHNEKVSVSLNRANLTIGRWNSFTAERRCRVHNAANQQFFFHKALAHQHASVLDWRSAKCQSLVVAIVRMSRLNRRRAMQSSERDYSDQPVGGCRHMTEE